jgi:hypothetical protein
MCDIEKQGAVSFPVSNLYPIRSEKKTRSLSLKIIELETGERVLG